MPKHSLRSQLLHQRRSLSHEAWQDSSRAAQLSLLALEEFAEAECIALYAPAHNEVDTWLILAEAFRAGKRVLYPAVCGQHMVFRHIDRADNLQRGAFGILEPGPTGTDLYADAANLIIVPGVAFDQAGHRLGYGKGFYDRFLHHPDCTAHLVGLCHDFQLINSHLPTDHHDIPMEIVVTDSRTIHIAQAKVGK